MCRSTSCRTRAFFTRRFASNVATLANTSATVRITKPVITSETLRMPLSCSFCRATGVDEVATDEPSSRSSKIISSPLEFRSASARKASYALPGLMAGLASAIRVCSALSASANRSAVSYALVVSRVAHASPPYPSAHVHVNCKSLPSSPSEGSHPPCAPTPCPVQFCVNAWFIPGHRGPVQLLFAPETPSAQAGQKTEGKHRYAEAVRVTLPP